MFSSTEIISCELDEMQILASGFAMSELIKDKTVSIDFIRVESESEGVMVVHNHTDEVIFPIFGELIGDVGGLSCAVKPGNCIKIKRGTPHKFTNKEKTVAGFISVCCPPFSMDDVIIIEEEKQHENY